MPENNDLVQGPTYQDTTPQYWHRVGGHDFFVRNHEEITNEQMDAMVEHLDRVARETTGDGVQLFNGTHGNNGVVGKKTDDKKPRESSFKLSEYLNG